MNSDIKALIHQLTLEEKAALCCGKTAWETLPIERLGIPSIVISDGPHGVRRSPDMASSSLPATCFPSASALAATWDVDLLYEMGEALADESIALGVDVLLGPGINIKRTPLCGRNFEYFSEDPYLGGELAASLINGIQSKGVGTSLKHFAVNNQETERMTISAEVDNRTLHEIYLLGFKHTIRKSNPWTVMCAYNRVNGIHASEHRQLLTEILRDNWGYEGVVVSDWGAVHDRVKALEAGLDLEMPGPQDHRAQLVVQAVQSGRLEESILDRSVERVLGLVAKAQQTPKADTTADTNANHTLARGVAGEAIVLLKNEGNLLPLDRPNTLAVIGLAAKQPHYQGGGSSHVNATQIDIPFEELGMVAGDAELSYAPGYTMEEGFDQILIDEAVAVARKSDVALLFVALPPFKESEGYDRPDIDLTEQQVALIKAVSAVQPHCVVILNNGSPVAMQDWIDQAPAVIEAWLMGQAGGGAVADVLFGLVNPSGRLAETFPMRLADTPAYTNFHGEAGRVYYGERLYVGYRYYDVKECDVLYPFGYGLSYTTFEYSNLRIDQPVIQGEEPLIITVDVTNTGLMAGKETVQIYVSDVDISTVHPIKELKGFAKVFLEPNETKTVTVPLRASAFAYYDLGSGEWTTKSGRFEILVCRSAADTVLRETVTLETENARPRRLGRLSTLGEWLANPQGKDVLEPKLATLFAQLEDLEIDLVGTRLYVGDILLETLLIWFGKDLPASPEAVVAQLLAEVETAS
ncbi:MAG: glycoside hydrolase family 3 C-terminal domain-containing protein [Candidatus Promineifilaceae bacterium]|nr:glycoside hydrolase family 3 C-terminal domain-containing protein [Candidatus Promineifilaceae bacterium]